MKNNVKEILDGLNAVIKQEGSLELDFKECKKILYYITNLQEENERLNNIIEEKKIPKKIIMRAGMFGSINNKLENLNINTRAVEDKINEIIDYLKSKGE